MDLRFAILGQADARLALVVGDRQPVSIERIGVVEGIVAGDTALYVGRQLETRGDRLLSFAGQKNLDGPRRSRHELAASIQIAQEAGEAQRLLGSIDGSIDDEEDAGRRLARRLEGDGLPEFAEGELGACGLFHLVGPSEGIATPDLDRLRLARPADRYRRADMVPGAADPAEHLGGIEEQLQPLWVASRLEFGRLLRRDIRFGRAIGADERRHRRQREEDADQAEPVRGQMGRGGQGGTHGCVSPEDGRGRQAPSRRDALGTLACRKLAREHRVSRN